MVKSFMQKLWRIVHLAFEKIIGNTEMYVKQWALIQRVIRGVKEGTEVV